jgi:hypothetical protein
MSSADLASPNPDAICAQLREQTLQACRVARIAAGIVAEGIATGVPSLFDGVREREKELDMLDRVIDPGVTWGSRSAKTTSPFFPLRRNRRSAPRLTEAITGPISGSASACRPTLSCPS